jgi:aromatic ring-opening dioxygenase catalytic subunit (LigB family)
MTNDHDHDHDHDQPQPIARRAALTTLGVTALGALVGASGVGCHPPSGSAPGASNAETKESRSPMASSPRSDTRLPVAFVPHGGGPWPFVDMGLDRKEVDELASYLRSVRALPKTPPKALLVVSAHWEAPVPTVMTSAAPPMLYDYFGFPAASYEIQWPAPGDPALAARVRSLLDGAGIASAEDAKRGFDHGTFVPLKLTYPDADIPTVQLSLQRGLDPARHLAIGRALAPLRDEGVFLVGSGMSYHNMGGFGRPSARAIADEFDAWLRDVTKRDPRDRDAALTAWTSAPSARGAHPREEHLLPLMVIAGAAGDDLGSTGFSGNIMGVRLSAHHFG